VAAGEALEMERLFTGPLHFAVWVWAMSHDHPGGGTPPELAGEDACATDVSHES